MDLGTLVRRIRLKHGMTLEELGDKLGKSKQYMSELERGNIRLTYEMATAIASVFQTTPDDFLLPSESSSLGPSLPDRSNSRRGEKA